MNMPADANQLIETEDGSLTLADTNVGELYHNRTGAYTEALKNYVEPSCSVQLFKQKGSLHVLDICFGLGYNTWVLLSKLVENTQSAGEVKVVAVEPDAGVLHLMPAVLAYPRLAALQQVVPKPLKAGLTRLPLSPAIEIELEILPGDLRQVVPAMQIDFDFIFHDGFSPKKMPELWTVDLFKQYYRLTQSHSGQVLTYSSASAVRGGLLEAGFSIWRTEALGGKSGGTLAACGSLSDEQRPFLYPLNDEEQKRVSSRSGIPYRDPHFRDSRQEILKRRIAEQSLKT